MDISNVLQDNIKTLKDTFNKDESLVLREFSIGGCRNIDCAAFFIGGLVDMARINDEIMSPLLEMKDSETDSDIFLPNVIKNKITSAQVETADKFDSIFNSLLNGDTVIVIDGYNKAITVSTLSMNRRKITEPDTEKVVRGPREGFNEALFENLALVRARLKSKDFKLHFRDIGRLTKTKVCLCYIENLASPELVKEAEKRLDEIDIDGILDTGYIQELIADDGYSPFRTIGHTERPDVVVGKLLEGRLAIFCDGTPFALTLPYLFIEYFHFNENYYNNFYFATFSRILSFIGFFITSSIPAVYTALVTFHLEMLPTPLILSISAARQGIPLPTIAEMIGILFIFEVLREASVRIPAVVGQTISIVGALIIGQAAVEAKLISAPIIIIAAAAGITGFLVPKMEQAVIILRLFYLISSAFMGLYGYIFCLILTYIHLTSMKSFGIPYMTITSSLAAEDQKDVIVRAPWWLMKNRPKILASRNTKRQNG